jgi:hypothetical protein
MKIYKLENLENGKFYIGQTTQQLSIRKGQHKYCFLNNIKPCTSKLIYQDCSDYKNIKIEILEELFTNSKMIALIREKFYINLYPDCVNKNLRD